MSCFEFAGHFLDLWQGRLRRGHVDVQLRHKSFCLLAYLVQNRGRVISKDELLSALWPEVIVTDDSLTQCIADIRRCLGPEARSLIRTVSRRGYILDESDVQVVVTAAFGAVPLRPQAEQRQEPAVLAPDAMQAFQPKEGSGRQQPVAPNTAFAGVRMMAAGITKDEERPDIKILRNVPILALLDTPQLKLVAFTSERMSLAEGHVLFRQGDEADAAYVILSGALDAYLERSDRRIHLSRNAEHAIVGEIGLLRDAPRSATVIAASDVEVLRIAKQVFLDLVAEVPTMALAIMREQIARLSHVEERLRE
jgi:DNA-binding winged helix-turn-helix (wHTH) protein